MYKNCRWQWWGNFAAPRFGARPGSTREKSEERKRSARAPRHEGAKATVRRQGINKAPIRLNSTAPFARLVNPWPCHPCARPRLSAEATQASSEPGARHRALPSHPDIDLSSPRQSRPPSTPPNLSSRAQFLIRIRLSTSSIPRNRLSSAPSIHLNTLNAILTASPFSIQILARVSQILDAAAPPLNIAAYRACQRRRSPGPPCTSAYRAHSLHCRPSRRFRRVPRGTNFFPGVIETSVSTTTSTNHIHT